MKLLGNITSHDSAAARRLALWHPKGFKGVRLTKGGIYFLIAENVENVTSGRRYELPEEAIGATCIFEVAEEGSGVTSDFGRGTVVCDPTGEPLLPFHVPLYKQVLGRHAYFRVPHIVVLVRTIHDHAPGVVTITEYRAVKENCSVRVEKSLIWNGLPDELPTDLRFFKNAVDAAVQTSFCRRCPHTVHYGLRERPVDLVLR